MFYIKSYIKQQQYVYAQWYMILYTSIVHDIYYTRSSLDTR